MHLFLYGPPGSGKTTLGQKLSVELGLNYWDLDHEIEKQHGRGIPEIFKYEGEPAFRKLELQKLNEICQYPPSVIALGGGALLAQEARSAAEAYGQILCLTAESQVLLGRLSKASEDRPLLAGDPAHRLHKLLADRAEHYASFANRLDTSAGTIDELCWQAQLRAGLFRVRGMGAEYDVRIQSGGLDRLGDHLRVRGLGGPVALISDQNVGAIYQARVSASLEKAGYAANTHCILPGEENKTLATVSAVWDFLIQSGIERGSTVVALGGGVVGDLTGFAAATFLRGVPWINVPTSLLAMVDSSLGGKTGVDLPQAKNLVGAFYPPRLVYADPALLGSLPARELRNGLAETLKHGVIADPDLFALCEQGWDVIHRDVDRVVRQGMAVKLKVIEQDPYEKDLRQALNLGHTIGHGVELASNFQCSHGESVAIGMVAEGRIAERIGLAQPGLAERIQSALAGLGLPVAIPEGLDRQKIVQAMQLDKKRAAGLIKFALPVRIGEVRTGVIVADWQRMIVERQFL